MSHSDPMMPADTPLSVVLNGMERDGFEAQFVPLEGGVVRCTAGGHTFSASSSAVERSRRLEGVSDPADMLLVVGVRCPICEVLGTLVLQYGPEASAEDADALALMAPT